MDEIVADVFTWAWFSEPHGYDFNGHLVRRADGTSALIRYDPTMRALPKSPGWAPRKFCSPIATTQGLPIWCASALAPGRSFTRTTPRMLAARELKSMGHCTSARRWVRSRSLPSPENHLGKSRFTGRSGTS